MHSWAYQYQQEPSIFNDDEPFEQIVKGNNTQAKLQISLRAQRSQVKLGQKTILPAMCSIKSSGGSRTSVDLICVIDVSGSMSGQKINLVRQTLHFLVQTLTPSDRLALITFNQTGKRICGLRTVTPQNTAFFLAKIDSLEARGGTSIVGGLDLALKTIRERKITNKVTSIFLLSDGLDKDADLQFKKVVAYPLNANLGVFRIDSFGFGEDHDEDMMNEICSVKDGSFYFIKQLSTLDQAFCNALGGIVSIVASNIILQVRSVASGLVKGVQIIKFYHEKWKEINKGQYQIRLAQLMTDISKDYVFQLSIPIIEGEVGDIGREHVVVEAIFSAKSLQQQDMGGVAALSLTLINAHQQIAEQLQNVDVVENYLRVKAAEAIQINMQKAEAQNFEQARKGIDSMIESIQNNKRVRKEKMEPLMKDLNLIRQKCSHKEYRQQGRKWMVNAREAHRTQGCYQYANPTQNQMVNKRRSQKQRQKRQ